MKNWHVCGYNNRTVTSFLFYIDFMVSLLYNNIQVEQRCSSDGAGISAVDLEVGSSVGSFGHHVMGTFLHARG